MEFLILLGGIAFVAIIASIGLYRTGDLRTIADDLPVVDEKLEDLADLYDELKGKIDELLGKVGK